MEQKTGEGMLLNAIIALARASKITPEDFAKEMANVEKNKEFLLKFTLRYAEETLGKMTEDEKEIKA